MVHCTLGSFLLPFSLVCVIAVRALLLAYKLPSEKHSGFCIFLRKVVLQNYSFTSVVYIKIYK